MTTECEVNEILADPTNTTEVTDLDTIEAKHYEVRWQRCGEDGAPDPDQPLPSFCGWCTDEEWVGAVEYGDTIDEGADVVSWPCEAVDLVTEVRRLRARVTELKAV